MSNRLKRPLMALALVGAFAMVAGATVHAKTPGPAVPKAGTAAKGLLDGLKAVHAGDKRAFESKHCSKKKLCSSKDAIKRMYQYNWPSAKRMAPKCLKGDKKSQIIVTRVQGNEASDSEVKVFISCIDGQRPRPYRMHKEGGSWKLANLF